MSNTKKVTISLTPEQQEKARSLSKEEYEKQILDFPVHSTARIVSDKEFAELELKNWNKQTK